jgi:hypothetical protein
MVNVKSPEKTGEKPRIWRMYGIALHGCLRLVILEPSGRVEVA